MSKKSPELENIEIEVTGPGEMLAQARINQGLSIDEVAKKLNFRVTLVKNIEADIYDKNLPDTYNRGYIKNYAKLVELPISDVIKHYEQLNFFQGNAAKMQSFSRGTMKKAENSRLMWITYLILTTFIVFTVIWWLQEDKQTSEANQLNTSMSKTGAVISTELISPNEPNTANNNLSQNNLPQSVIPKQENLAEPVNFENADSLQANQLLNQSGDLQSTIKDNTQKSLKGNIQPIGSDSLEFSFSERPKSDNSLLDKSLLDKPLLHDKPFKNTLLDNNKSENIASDNSQLTQVIFTFSGDCWVNIQDALGERVAWGIKKLGYVMTIEAKTPLKITIGKPELVKINFDGKNIDMSDFPKGHIAKFNLPLLPQS